MVMTTKRKYVSTVISYSFRYPCSYNAINKLISSFASCMNDSVDIVVPKPIISGDMRGSLKCYSFVTLRRSAEC